MSTVLLSSLRPGMDCRLLELNLYGTMRRRLQELGFLPGAPLRCAFLAPSGSPMAVVCKGTMIALRRDVCDKLQVKLNV